MTNYGNSLRHKNGTTIPSEYDVIIKPYESTPNMWHHFKVDDNAYSLLRYFIYSPFYWDRQQEIIDSFCLNYLDIAKTF